MKIAILQATSARLSCTLSLRVVEILKRLAPEVDIVIGVAPNSPAMSFYETYETDDFECRATTIVTMDNLEHKRVYRRSSDSEQLYRFTDGGSDFKDVDAMILCGAPSGTFANPCPYMLIFQEPASTVHQMETDILIGYFETIRHASTVLFSNKRNQAHWSHYALHEDGLSTHESLPGLDMELLTSRPFHKVGAPYIAYFTDSRGSSLIEGDHPNHSYIINLPDDQSENSDFERRWNLIDAMNAAERISLHPFQIGNFIREADIVLIEHIEDKQDPRISAAHHFNKPLVMLLDDVTDSILGNLDITLGIKSHTEEKEIGQALLQAAKSFDASKAEHSAIDQTSDDLNETVLQFLKSVETGQLRNVS